jgi:hypothetical protein
MKGISKSIPLKIQILSTCIAASLWYKILVLVTKSSYFNFWVVY